MKKLFVFLFLVSLFLASCGNNKNIAYDADPDLKQYVSGGFELYYPKSWTTVQSENGYATVYSFDSLTLISFSRAGVLSVKDTYEKLKKGFMSKGEAVQVKTSKGIKIELIKFKGYVNNFVYKTTVDEGTIALWNNGKTSYALLDAANMHQSDGAFETLYDSFNYLK